jgi:hypothetical protein
LPPAHPGQADRLLDVHERQVGVRIIADEPRVEMAAVLGEDTDTVRGLGDMTVGQDQAVGRQDDA